MRSRVFPFIALLLFLWAAAPAAALSGGGIVSYEFGCDSVTITHLAIFLNRDNTGLGSEVFTLTITDGSGNELENEAENGEIGEAITSATRQFDYLTPPVSNPIRVRLVSNAGNGFEEQTIWDLVGNSPCLPPVTTTTSFTGAGIPAGFVMHHIACTTPVYTEPAGVPVGNDRVLEGQTWFVDPEPVTGTDGQQWTEIFVGSFINPWIPTACVGGVAPLTPA